MNLFQSLADKKREEIIQILTDHGIRLPKDDYYHKTTTIGHKLITIIGRQYTFRIESDLMLYVWTKLSDKDIYLNTIRLHNPVGPAIVDLNDRRRFPDQYYINGKQLTKQQFITHRTSQRIKLINE